MREEHVKRAAIRNSVSQLTKSKSARLGVLVFILTKIKCQCPVE